MSRFSLHNGRDIIAANVQQQLTTNLTSMSRQFFSNLLDPRRSIDDECGYPPTSAIGPNQYRDLYDREPIATRAIQLMPKECWQVSPLIYEEESGDSVTSFEAGWDEMEVNLAGERSWHQEEQGSSVWEMLYRVDCLSRIGSFGVLLFGFDDGKPLDQPVDGIEAVTNIKDGWCTKEQEEAILNAKDRQTHWSIPGEDSRNISVVTNTWLPLSEQEKRIVQGWGNEREEIHRKALSLNAAPESLLSGTERQYDRQYDQALGASPSGTDQQYFGIQFGPSEQFGEEPAKGPRKLLFLRAFDESLVQVVRYEWNIRNPRFGMPVMYRITLNDPRETHSGVGLPLATVFVHWSRIQHVNDVNSNPGSSEIFSPPILRPILNPILDIRKVRGASAEGYWKSCFVKLSFETHPQLGGDVLIDVSKMRDMMEQVENGLQPWWTLSGMSAKTIAPQVIDPSSFLNTYLEAICIQLGCPVRVFKGSERGELASSQDDSAWNDRIRHRQNIYLTPRLIVPFIDRLIQVGVLPAPGKGAAQKAVENAQADGFSLKKARGGWLVFNETDTGPKATGFISLSGYSVEWPDLDSLGDRDRAAILTQRVQAYAAYAQGGLEALIPPKEFMTKFDALTEEQADAIIAEAEAVQEEDMLLNPPQPEGFPPGQGPPGAEGEGFPEEGEEEVDETEDKEDV